MEDLIIIGAGPGGYETAIKAANLAAPVLSAVENVSGRVLEAAKEHSYRDGVRDGRREQKKRDLPAIAGAILASAAIAQVPYLVLALMRRKQAKEEAARRAAEEDRTLVEHVRDLLRRDIERFRKN